MKHYTDTIPVTLAEKLKEKGMPMPVNYADLPQFSLPTFGYCFDWLMENNIQILLFRNNDGRNIGCDAEVWSFKIGFTKLERKDTWHEAADKAIEKALEMI